MEKVSNNIKRGQANNLIPFIPEGDFFFSKGVEAFQKRKFDLALKWMSKAVQFGPKNPLYLCQMSVIYTEIGSYHKANHLLTNVLHTYGEQYSDCYYLLANNFAHLGLFNDAIKYAELYLEKDPEGDFCDEARDLLQLIEIDDEETDDEGWATGLIEDEDELLIYQETIFHHLELEEWDKAILLLEEMFILFPDHLIAKHEYAFALFHIGKKEEAIQMELDLLEKDSNHLYSCTNLALFYFLLGDMEKHDFFIKEITNVYPIHEQQKLRVAVTFAKTMHYKEAFHRFSLLQKAQMKGHISYYQWFSVAAYNIGEVSKAESIWNEGYRNHPLLAIRKKPWKK